MPLYRGPIGHRTDFDGSSTPGAHAPHYVILESLSPIWEGMLRQLGDLLPPARVTLVRATVDFRREMVIAPAEFDVEVARVGRTSFEFAVRILQSGQLAVTAQLVIVHLVPDRSATMPLSAEQRAALETLMAPAASAVD